MVMIRLRYRGRLLIPGLSGCPVRNTLAQHKDEKAFPDRRVSPCELRYRDREEPLRAGPLGMTGARAMNEIAALTQRIEKLEHELAVQQDIHQIRRIQYTYGYFIDKSQYNEVVDLFADDGEVWFLGGIFRGKAGVRRLYIGRFQTRFTDGHNGPRYGWLLDHPQMQMVIDVAADRRTGKVRGRSTMQAGLHHTAKGQQRAWWEGGIYENDY